LTLYKQIMVLQWSHGPLLVLNDQPHPFELLHQVSFQRQRRLLLLLSERVLMYGLEVSEYASPDHPRVYINIEKVDSVATQKPTSGPSLIRSLVSCYLKACSQQYGKDLHVHVFARSQPEYLFQQSSKNEKKHVLSDIQLIQWWAKGLQQVSEQVHVFVPGYEPSLLSLPPTIHWGFPFDRDHVARTHIPQFPDDPIRRAVHLVGKKGLVSEWMDILETLSEFSSGHPAAFISVHIPCQKDKKECSVKEKTMTLDSAIEYLFQADFSTDLKAKQTSMEFLRKFEAQGEILNDKPITMKKKHPLANNPFNVKKRKI
jgi:hypothetical protein